MARGRMLKAKLIALALVLLCCAPLFSSPAAAQNAGELETVIIDQVNYADAGDDYLILRVHKQVALGALIGLGVLLVLALVTLGLVAAKKKRDPRLTLLYGQLREAGEQNEIYGLFNAMLKHRYNLSIKASSQNAIRAALPNPALADQVVEIMDFVESGEKNNPDFLKNKIKAIYKTFLSKS